MSVDVKQDAIVLREKLAQIQPFDPNPNFGSMPTVGNTPILESDSNANGNWIKYEDGTMICWFIEDVLKTTVNAIAPNNVLYRSSANTSYVFALPFIEEPAVNPFGKPAAVSNLFLTASLISNDGSATQTPQITLVGADSSYSGYIGYYAIGKWK